MADLVVLLAGALITFLGAAFLLKANRAVEFLKATLGDANDLDYKDDKMKPSNSAVYLLPIK